MKKNLIKIMGAIISVVLVANVAVYATTGKTVTDNISQAVELHTVLKSIDKEYQLISNGNITMDMQKYKNLHQMFTKANMDDVSKNEAFAEYIHMTILYDATPREESYIVELVNQGYDYARVMKIYNYLKQINEDINLIQAIYDDTKDCLEDEFWLPNSYAKQKNVDGLNLSEVQEYVSAGISVDEILLCDEMSLQTKVNIGEVLDKRVEGKSWYDIAAPLYHLPENVEFTEQPGIGEIVSAANVSIRSGLQMQEVCMIKDGSLKISEKASQILEEKTEKINELKKAWNVEEVSGE